MTSTEKTRQLVGPPKGEDFCDVVPGSEDSGLDHYEEQDKVDQEAARKENLRVTPEDIKNRHRQKRLSSRTHQSPNEAPDVVGYEILAHEQP